MNETIETYIDNVRLKQKPLNAIERILVKRDEIEPDEAREIYQSLLDECRELTSLDDIEDALASDCGLEPDYVMVILNDLA